MPRAREGADLVIDGERVHYVEQGGGDAIVLIHGFPGSGQLSFGRLLPLLPPDRRVVAIDLVGLGWSDRGRLGDYAPAAQAPRVLKVMDALDIDVATVVGSSFGGAVAQHVALLEPERVQRLVLLASLDAHDPPRSWKKEWHYACRILLLLTALRAPWLGRRLRLKVAKPYTGWTTEWDEQAAIDATRYTQLPGTARSALKIMRDMTRATSADITRIGAATLVVSGSADTRVPPSVGNAIAAQVAGARHVVLAGCPHGLAQHQPQAIADLIAD
ncbi:MAG: alpha/beta hydrolase [Acidimicrobiales bacterium]